MSQTKKPNQYYFFSILTQKFVIYISRSFQDFKVCCFFSNKLFKALI